MAYKRISPQPVVEGGTGNSTLTIHTLLIGNSTSAVTQLANGTTGQALLAVTGLDPVWGAIDLTTDVTGVLPVANGGTGSSSFTAGSVVFSNGTTLAEDNANFFWDDTNNRLGLGTATPLDTFQIVGNQCLQHTASEADDHALEIICDAAGFGDVKAIDIDFITGAVAGGDSEEAILINIDETGSSGGEVFGIEILATAGSATAFGMRTGVNVGPIAQFAGTLADADTILNKAVDVTAALANGGAGNITAFVLDNETMTIGDAAQFGEMEIIIDTPASGAGIAPTFEYSTGVGTWASFSPTDGTNGMRNTGEIAWDPADIAWMVGTGSEFLIRITRTRNTLGTVPILDEIQIAATTTYTWDKTGEISILSLIVADLTQYTLPIAGVAGALDDLADGLGSSGEVLTSNGAGAEPTWQAGGGGGGITWNEETGTSVTMVVDNGYITNNAGLVTATLPTTAALGVVVRVAGKGAGGWLIAQNASEIIHFGTTDTTTGVGGSLASTETYDAVELLCIVADTEWVVLSSLGNITIV